MAQSGTAIATADAGHRGMCACFYCPVWARLIGIPHLYLYLGESRRTFPVESPAAFIRIFANLAECSRLAGIGWSKSATHL